MSAFTSSVATPMTTARALRIGAALGLAVAGSIHLALAPGHMALSPALSIAFLGAGSMQVALAVVLSWHHHVRLVAVAAVTSALFIAVFAYDLTVGLPMVSHAGLHVESHSHSHAGESSTHHPAQAFDPSPLVAKSAEIVTLVSSGVLLARSRRGVTSAMTERRR